MKRVAVIGGGPGGLVVLKYLTQAHSFLPVEPVQVRLFEADDAIGGTFYQRTYEDGEVRNRFYNFIKLVMLTMRSQQVSSKYLTTFSDFRPLASDPDFLSMNRYLGYLDEYCTHFDLWKHIELGTRVTKLRRKGSGHVITLKKQGRKDTQEEDWECDAVAICTGLHVEPHIPHVDGIEHIPTVIHSSEFKERNDFGENKNVVVLGVGETGMDIAHLAVTSPTASVTVCHRRGFLGGPKIRMSSLVLRWY